MREPVPPVDDPHSAAPAGGSGPGAADAPTLLDLLRLAPRPSFPPGGESLYRQIGILAELAPGRELLDVASGRGTTTTFLASTYGVDAVGLDPDPALVADAEARARGAGLEPHLHFQRADLDDLPFQDGVFDVVIGGIGLTSVVDPDRGIGELARVTRAGGVVVLVQLVWNGNVEPAERDLLAGHLGATPRLLVEWKQMLRDAGCPDQYVEDWSDYAGPFRPDAGGPFRELARTFSLRDRATILLRALRVWGWSGVRLASEREHAARELLRRPRILGLSLIRATRAADEPADSEEGRDDDGGH